MQLPRLNLTTLTAGLGRLAPGKPARDWRVLLALGGLALIIIVLWSVWVFETVIGGGTIGAPPPAQTTSTTASLETIRTLLDARAAEDAKYLDGTYRYSDPALTSGKAPSATATTSPSGG